MKRRRWFGISVTVAFVLAAALAATANALPELLPSKANNLAFTSTATKRFILENNEGKEIPCTSATGFGGFTTDTLGTYHLTMEGCGSEGFACETSGDSPAKSILTLGSFHFVYDTLGPLPNNVKTEAPETLGIAILFLPETTNFECVGGLIKNKIIGELLCLILEPLKLSITHEFHCLPGTKSGEKGEQLEQTYWNDNGTIITGIHILSSLNSGDFEESNLQELSTITTPEPAAFMNE